MIEQSCDIPLKLLIRAGFIDSRPYRRIHDWWAIQGNYLKIRYKNQPENWQRIENLYKRSLEPSMHRSVDRSKDGSNSMDVQYNTDVRTVRTYGRTLKDARETAQDAPLAGAALAPNGHNWISSEQPTNEFMWNHLVRTLNDTERVQSKLREKGYLNGKK